MSKRAEFSGDRGEGPAMVVPLIRPDLPPFQEVADDLEAALATGRVSNFGRHQQGLEEAVARRLGTGVLAVSSGTAALILALQCLPLPAGSRVVIPSFTFAATGQAVLNAGGVPLFCEVGEDLTLSTADLERLLEDYDDIAAVVPVHTFGFVADVAGIRAIVQRAKRKHRRPIAVVYDAAHAFGGEGPAGPVGTFGDCEVFSTSFSKIFSTVEGGLVCSRDEGFLDRVRVSRNYGIEARSGCSRGGLNGKMSELHAIIGLANLRVLDERLAERRAKALRYRGKLAAIGSARPPTLVEGSLPTFKDFTVLLDDRVAGRRALIAERMARAGIETRTYFSPPLHATRFFARYADRPLPSTDRLARSVLTLPFYTSMEDAEMNYVVDVLRSAIAEG